jgi:hypothetical protein
MALSDEWTDWHLTPVGWKRGDERDDGAGRTHRPLPPDRAATFRYREVVSSAYRRIASRTSEEWRGPDAALVENLLKQFGPCPERL